MVSPPIAELVEGNDPSGDTTPGDLSKYNPCNQCRVWAINECLSLSVSTAVVLVHQQVGYSRIWLWFIAGNDEPNRCLCAHKVTLAERLLGQVIQDLRRRFGDPLVSYPKPEFAALFDRRKGCFVHHCGRKHKEERRYKSWIRPKADKHVKCPPLNEY